MREVVKKCSIKCKSAFADNVEGTPGGGISIHSYISMYSVNIVRSCGLEAMLNCAGGGGNIAR